MAVPQKHTWLAIRSRSAAKAGSSGIRAMEGRSRHSLFSCPQMLSVMDEQQLMSEDVARRKHEVLAHLAPPLPLCQLAARAEARTSQPSLH